MSFLGKEVDNSELVAAGYKLKLEEKKEKFGNDEFTSWQLEWVNAGDSTVDVQQIADGGSLGLQTPQLVDADGKVIAEFSGKSYSSFGSNSQLGLEYDNSGRTSQSRMMHSCGLHLTLK